MGFWLLASGSLIPKASWRTRIRHLLKRFVFVFRRSRIESAMTYWGKPLNN